MKQRNFPIFHKLKISLFYPGLILFIITGCGDKNNHEKQSDNLLSNELIQQVFNARDARDTDSLLVYLGHPTADVRRVAAEGFASVQDSAAIYPLNNLLISDNESSVRNAAAFAMGHMFDSTASLLLVAALDVELVSTVRNTIFEAIGKGISQSDLPKFNQQLVTEKIEIEGFAWGLYRAALRGVYDDLSIATAIEYLKPDYSFETRLASSHFFARGRLEGIIKWEDQLIGYCNTERSPEILMQLSSALAKMEGEGSLAQLYFLAENSDPRVRINALRAISSRGYNEESWTLLKSKLFDEDINVSVAVAEAIRSWNEEDLLAELRNLNLDSLNWRSRNNIIRYMAAKDDVLETVKSYYLKSTLPFDKAELLSIIGREISEIDFIINETFQSEDDIIKSRGMNALFALRRLEDFPVELKEDFEDIIREAISSNDAVLTRAASNITRFDTLGFRKAFEDYTFIEKQIDKSEDPLITHWLNDILNFVKSGDDAKSLERTQKSIPWNVVKKLKDEEQIIIRTDKGDIRLRLFSSEAPASVINMILLAEEGFYDNTYYHRVVPNFVIQGGSNIGDGSGGSNYIIRSEFTSRKYSTGTLGMASAGKDTEGSQFFITHSPTPHLDGGFLSGSSVNGGYTTFGEVIDGLDVVNSIEVGDKILTIIRVE